MKGVIQKTVYSGGLSWKKSDKTIPSWGVVAVIFLSKPSESVDESGNVLAADSSESAIGTKADVKADVNLLLLKGDGDVDDLLARSNNESGVAMLVTINTTMRISSCPGRIISWEVLIT
jgi:hypothetical protein